MGFISEQLFYRTPAGGTSEMHWNKGMSSPKIRNLFQNILHSIFVDKNKKSNLYMDTNSGSTKDILLEEKINQYAESFTIHGLPRILTGNKTERTVWSVFVVLALSFAGYMVYRYVSKYLRYEVSHNFSRSITDKAFYPSVTFCLPEIKEEMGLSQIDCVVPKRYIFSTKSNGIFNIDVCRLGNSSICGDDSVLWREDLKGICFTLFPTKKYYQLTQTALVQFFVADDLLDIKQISVTLHDQNLDPLFLTPQLQIVPNERYFLNLKKTVSKRLPHPFRSNCTNKTKDHNFPGNYNRRTCLFVNRYIESYKKSNIITSIGALYIPQSIMLEYKHRQNITGTYNYQYDDHFTEIEWNDPACPLSCYDIEYEVSYSLKGISYPSIPFDDEMISIENETEYPCPKLGKQFTKFSHFHVEFSFERPELFHLLEEKQTYTLENLLAELGGILGLTIGISMIFVVELFAYFTMHFMNKLSKIYTHK